MTFFEAIETFFNKLIFIDNSNNSFSSDLLIDFSKNEDKMRILNKLISTSNLFVEKRGLISEEDILLDINYEKLLKTIILEKNKSESNNNFKSILDLLKVTSFYKNCQGEDIGRPSVFFDSLGTNKFINLAMAIINSIIDNNILLIDEIDSSLHYKLTRALVILMNSSSNTNAQFIMTSHDVKLLSPSLFRKDQINFINRDEEGVYIISLDSFKANSQNDIRSTSNFEKMYLEETIVSLPQTDIYQVIKEFEKYETKN